jgi:four helix bundle protein
VLANTINELTLRPNFSKDFKLRDQILDASGSVMPNIAEGCDSGTDPEFIRFLKMARRSSSEVQSELYLALDRKYIMETKLKQAYDQADEVKRLINGLIAYLRKSGTNTANKVSEHQGHYSSAPYEHLADPHDEETDDQPDEDQTVDQ